VPEQPLTLDILTQEGDLVRRFVGTAEDTDAAASSASEQRMGEPPVPASSVDTFTVHPGHNRFQWNLRHPGPNPPSEGRGPLAVPGTYQVRLSGRDWRQTRSFDLKMDPRLEKTGTTRADLEEQFFFNRRLQDAMEAAEATAHAIDSMRTEVQEAHEAGEMPESEAQPLLDQLDELHGKLVTSEEGSYQPPMLIDQFGYLAWMTGSADQELGEDAFSRFETLRSRLDRIQDRWHSLRADIEMPTTD
jgi:hypothetical protein